MAYECIKNALTLKHKLKINGAWLESANYEKPTTTELGCKMRKTVGTCV